MPSQVKGSELSVITAALGVNVFPQASVTVGNVKVSVASTIHSIVLPPSASAIVNGVVMFIVMT